MFHQISMVALKGCIGLEVFKILVMWFCQCLSLQIKCFVNVEVDKIRILRWMFKYHSTYRLYEVWTLHPVFLFPKNTLQFLVKPFRGFHVQQMGNVRQDYFFGTGNTPVVFFCNL